MLELRDGWAFGIAARDGYVGYVEEADLEPELTPTHTISARATHLYPRDDFKIEAVTSLSFGSRIKVVDERHKFMEIEGGLFVPKAHVRPIGRPFSDPVTIAQIFSARPISGAAIPPSASTVRGLCRRVCWPVAYSVRGTATCRWGLAPMQRTVTSVAISCSGKATWRCVSTKRC